MKSMTCNQLGGPKDCANTFIGDSFEDIAEQSKAHAMEMASQEDQPHKDKMNEMKVLMESEPKAAHQWYADKQTMFEQL